MSLTSFDKIESKIGTYLKNNPHDKATDDKFFSTMLNGLRGEYAPNINMTKTQYDLVFPLIQEGKELGATFTEFWEIYKFTGASEKIPPVFKSQEQGMNVWLHPETIKIVDE